MATLTDHFALLVGISRYPGLTSLGGPENDTASFAEWLIDPAGGNLSENNVVQINSADFPPTDEPEDPDNSGPTETAFKKALNNWCRDAENEWRRKVGRRLYLFFAGHGFTAGSIPDPALLTAQAQLGDTAHIAAYRYASKIVNAGFFDEVFLIMDCCQDVLKAAAVNEPTWAPPDLGASDNVLFFSAFAAPRGRKARENMAPDNKARGFFSRLFLEALREAPADSSGNVMAPSVADTLVRKWNEGGFPKLTSVLEPPINAPRSLNIYRRPVAPDGAPPAQIVEHPGLAEIGSKLPGASDFNLNLRAEDGATDIKIFDKSFRAVGSGTGQLLTSLATGEYQAHLRLGDSVNVIEFTVAEDGRTPALTASEMPFSSAVPLPGTLTTHEYQMYPAAAARARVGIQPDGRSPIGAALFIFARDSFQQMGAAPRMPEPVRTGIRTQERQRNDGL